MLRSRWFYFFIIGQVVSNIGVVDLGLSQSIDPLTTHDITPSLAHAHRELFSFAPSELYELDVKGGTVAKPISSLSLPGQGFSHIPPRIINPAPPRAKPTLLNVSIGVQQIIENRENPAYAGPGEPLAGSNGSPFGQNPARKTGAFNTTNDFAQIFFKKFPMSVDSVAAVIRVSDIGLSGELLGTAVLVGPDAIVSAGHVVQSIIKRNWYTQGPAKTTENKIFLVFDLDITKFPKGIPPSYDGRNPKGVEIPVGSWAVTHPNPDIDVGAIRIPPQGSRIPASISVVDVPDNIELALIGVPGIPQDDEAGSVFRWRDNYKIFNLPTSTSLEGNAPVTIRIGTGKFLERDATDKPWSFHFNIDTLGGNSGSSIIDATTGKLVGINYSGEIGYSTNLRFNNGVRAQAVTEVITALPR